MKTFTLVVFATLCLSVFFLSTTNSNPSTTNILFTFDGLQVLAFGNSDRVSDGILDDLSLVTKENNCIKKS
ncbi:MAG: hypothetical protein FD167_6217 [bacterium]|nr:MAG: hypothetical protein FD167_6217 [bacterium]